MAEAGPKFQDDDGEKGTPHVESDRVSEAARDLSPESFSSQDISKQNSGSRTSTPEKLGLDDDEKEAEPKLDFGGVSLNWHPPAPAQDQYPPFPLSSIAPNLIYPPPAPVFLPFYPPLPRRKLSFPSFAPLIDFYDNFDSPPSSASSSSSFFSPPFPYRPQYYWTQVSLIIAIIPAPDPG